MTFWVAGAALGSAVIGAVSSRKAAKQQAKSADNATELQREMFEKQNELQEPFRQAGISSKNRLMTLLGMDQATSGDPEYGSLMRDFSAGDFQADPGYQFRQAEGQKGLERSAAARGGLLSGGAVREAMRFNSGLASQEYGNAFNRFQTNRTNKLNPLQSLMGAGQASSNTLGSAAQSYGANAGNTMMQAGSARASGTMGAANAISSGIGQGWNMYQQNRLYDAYENDRKNRQTPVESWRTTGNGYDYDYD
jgi:hypothetical protein